jgi:CRP/FNR family cyclic AMP-dependent transcriptional regulator
VDNPVWTYIFGPPKEKRAVISLMKSLPAFEGLSQKELITIERILHQRWYKAGEKVFGEDMPGAGMYIVKEGEVVIKKRIDEEKEVDLAVITERNFFGELALIDEMPRSASAIAQKDTVLLAFCKPDLENIKDRNPRVAAQILTNIARLVCKRLVKANENLEILEKKLANQGARRSE